MGCGASSQKVYAVTTASEEQPGGGGGTKAQDGQEPQDAAVAAAAEGGEPAQTKQGSFEELLETKELPDALTLEG